MLKIAYAQMEIVAGRPDLNAEKILNYVEQAKEKSADIVIFPELCLSGKFVGNNFEKTSFMNDCKFFGEKIISASENITVIFGNVDGNFVAKNGKIILKSNSTKIFSSEFGEKFNFCIKIASRPFSLSFYL
ncbi:MAG: hypothetical protein IJU55_04830, partial [Selenomonadaceae bacterium]|nr:hypothetical protein [Selenomonadaceae bacterium]